MQIIEEITQLINQSENLNGSHCDALFESFYPKIKKLAQFQLHKLNPGHHMSATVLVNECYLKLKHSNIKQLKNKKHFYSLVARSMRYFLIDLIKAQHSQKRQGFEVTLKAKEISNEADYDSSLEIQLLDLDRAIEQLKTIDEELSEITELRFFAGLTLEEIAQAHEKNLSQVYKQWKVAQAMLTHFME